MHHHHWATVSYGTLKHDVWSIARPGLCRCPYVIDQGLPFRREAKDLEVIEKIRFSESKKESLAKHLVEEAEEGLPFFGGALKSKPLFGFVPNPEGFGSV